MRRVVAFLSAALIVVAGCSSEPARPERDSSRSEEAAPPARDEVPEDPIAQMEVAFNGHPRQAVIREALDAAFAATDTPVTSENYSRAGSVLVTFRQEYGIDEMDILECVPSRANDPRAPEKTFPNVAAVCVAELSGG